MNSIGKANIDLGISILLDSSSPSRSGRFLKNIIFAVLIGLFSFFGVFAVISGRLYSRNENKFARVALLDGFQKSSNPFLIREVEFIKMSPPDILQLIANQVDRLYKDPLKFHLVKNKSPPLRQIKGNQDVEMVNTRSPLEETKYVESAFQRWAPDDYKDPFLSESPESFFDNLDY